MKTTIETLEQIRLANGKCTDYRLAKLLKITPNYISMMRYHGRKMTEEQRIRAAELLHEDPELHLIYRSIERAKNTGAKKTWLSTLSKVNASAAALVLAIGLYIPSHNVSAESFYETTGYTLCAYVIR